MAVKNVIKIKRKAKADIRGKRINKDAPPTFNEPMHKNKLY